MVNARKTRKGNDLARMDALLPWARMLSVIEPVYRKLTAAATPYCEFTTYNGGITIYRWRHGRLCARRWAYR